MVAAQLILAQAPAPRLGLDPELLWTLLALAGVVAVSGLILTVVNRWRKGLTQEDATGDQMASFRELYERGELSQDEYERIKGRLGQRLRSELNLPAPGGPNNPPQPPTPPSPPDAPAPNL